jgi:N6-L-threonylcarbamoyladenine synthase
MPKALLAFESSCDETAVAVVSEHGEILAQALASQIEIHRAYGGVVPEVASRTHFEVVDALAAQVLSDPAHKNFRIDGVAATLGPGLVGPLLVGACYAEGFASGRGLPFYGVHHLRGHLASVLLQNKASAKTLREIAHEVFPALVLLVSGGHTQILRVEPDLKAHKLADTADDAAGECLDKSAKLMGMPYPGGPAIETKAREMKASELELGEQILRSLPKPRSSEGFSFSGLKTSIRQKLEKDPSLGAHPAFCWAIQECVAQSLVRGLERATRQLAGDSDDLKSLVFCGGVSANLRIRECMNEWAKARKLELRLAPLKYCTDNAAMIAAAAWVQSHELALGQVASRLSLETP